MATLLGGMGARLLAPALLFSGGGSLFGLPSLDGGSGEGGLFGGSTTILLIGGAVVVGVILLKKRMGR